MDTINVSVTGYCATGSSAAIDLLREYERMKVAVKNGYEHVVFYMPGSLFDLEDKLLQNNDPHRSDEAIRTFLNTMRLLAHKDFGWFGSYDMVIGPAFMKSVNTLVERISQKEETGIWYGRYKGVHFSPVKVALQLAAKIVYKRKVTKWGRQYSIEKGPMYFSVPTREEFFQAGGEFARQYLQLTAKEGANMIYDHLLWPSQLNRLDLYFQGCLKVLVLNRDPRDVYLLSKYVYPQPPILEPTPYPSNPQDFCTYWRKLRLNDGDIHHHPNILQVQFEDLIYQYDDTVEEIERFLGLSPSQHIQPKKFLDPAKSIVNTQLKLIKPEWAEEVRYIEEQLPEYLYDFPRKEAADLKDVLYSGVDFFEE